AATVVLHALTRGGLVSLPLEKATLLPRGSAVESLPRFEVEEATGLALERLSPGEADLLPVEGGLLLAAGGALFELRQKENEKRAAGDLAAGKLELAARLEIPAATSLRLDRGPGPDLVTLRAELATSQRFALFRVRRSPLRLEPWE